MASTWKSPKSTTDLDLVKLCEQKYKLSNCTLEEESVSSANKQTHVPPNTVAVIVNFDAPGGAIIFGRESKNIWGWEHVGKVGSVGSSDNLDIISWLPEWDYYTIGEVKSVKYVKKAEETQKVI